MPPKSFTTKKSDGGRPKPLRGLALDTDASPSSSQDPDTTAPVALTRDRRASVSSTLNASTTKHDATAEGSPALNASQKKPPSHLGARGGPMSNPLTPDDEPRHRSASSTAKQDPGVGGPAGSSASAVTSSIGGHTGADVSASSSTTERGPLMPGPPGSVQFAATAERRQSHSSVFDRKNDPAAASGILSSVTSHRSSKRGSVAILVDELAQSDRARGRVPAALASQASSRRTSIAGGLGSITAPTPKDATSSSMAAMGAASRRKSALLPGANHQDDITSPPGSPLTDATIGAPSIPQRRKASVTGANDGARAFSSGSGGSGSGGGLNSSVGSASPAMGGAGTRRQTGNPTFLTSTVSSNPNAAQPKSASEKSQLGAHLSSPSAFSSSGGLTPRGGMMSPGKRSPARGPGAATSPGGRGAPHNTRPNSTRAGKALDDYKQGKQLVGSIMSEMLRNKDQQLVAAMARHEAARRRSQGRIAKLEDDNDLAQADVGDRDDQLSEQERTIDILNRALMARMNQEEYTHFFQEFAQEFGKFGLASTRSSDHAPGSLSPEQSLSGGAGGIAPGGGGSRAKEQIKQLQSKYHKVQSELHYARAKEQTLETNVAALRNALQSLLEKAQGVVTTQGSVAVEEFVQQALASGNGKSQGEGDMTGITDFQQDPELRRMAAVEQQHFEAKMKARVEIEKLLGERGSLEKALRKAEQEAVQLRLRLMERDSAAAITAKKQRQAAQKLEEALKAAQEELAAAQGEAARQVEDYESRISDVKTELVEKAKILSQTAMQASELKTEVAAAKEAVEALRRQSNDIADERRIAEAEITELKAAMSEQNEATSQERRAMETKIRALEADVRSKQDMMAVLHRDLQQAQDHEDLTKNSSHVADTKQTELEAHLQTMESGKQKMQQELVQALREGWQLRDQNAKISQELEALQMLVSNETLQEHGIDQGDIVDMAHQLAGNSNGSINGGGGNGDGRTPRAGSRRAGTNPNRRRGPMSRASASMSPRARRDSDGRGLLSPSPATSFAAGDSQSPMGTPLESQPLREVRLSPRSIGRVEKVKMLVQDIDDAAKAQDRQKIQDGLTKVSQLFEVMTLWRRKDDTNAKYSADTLGPIDGALQLLADTLVAAAFTMANLPTANDASIDGGEAGPRGSPRRPTNRSDRDGDRGDQTPAHGHRKSVMITNPAELHGSPDMLDLFGDSDDERPHPALDDDDVGSEAVSFTRKGRNARKSNASGTSGTSQSPSKRRGRKAGRGGGSGVTSRTSPVIDDGASDQSGGLTPQASRRRKLPKNGGSVTSTKQRHLSVFDDSSAATTPNVRSRQASGAPTPTSKRGRAFPSFHSNDGHNDSTVTLTVAGIDVAESNASTSHRASRSDGLGQTHSQIQSQSRSNSHSQSQPIMIDAGDIPSAGASVASRSDEHGDMMSSATLGTTLGATHGAVTVDGAVKDAKADGQTRRKKPTSVSPRARSKSSVSPRARAGVSPRAAHSQSMRTPSKTPQRTPAATPRAKSFTSSKLHPDAAAGHSPKGRKLSTVSVRSPTATTPRSKKQSVTDSHPHDKGHHDGSHGGRRSEDHGHGKPPLATGLLDVLSDDGEGGLGVPAILQVSAGALRSSLCPDEDLAQQLQGPSDDLHDDQNRSGYASVPPALEIEGSSPSYGHAIQLASPTSVSDGSQRSLGHFLHPSDGEIQSFDRDKQSSTSDLTKQASNNKEKPTPHESDVRVPSFSAASPAPIAPGIPGVGKYVTVLPTEHVGMQTTESAFGDGGNDATFCGHGGVSVGHEEAPPADERPWANPHTHRTGASSHRRSSTDPPRRQSQLLEGVEGSLSPRDRMGTDQSDGSSLRPQVQETMVFAPSPAPQDGGPASPTPVLFTARRSDQGLLGSVGNGSRPAGAGASGTGGDDASLQTLSARRSLDTGRSSDLRASADRSGTEKTTKDSDLGLGCPASPDAMAHTARPLGLGTGGDDDGVSGRSGVPGLSVGPVALAAALSEVGEASGASSPLVTDRRPTNVLSSQPASRTSARVDSQKSKKPSSGIGDEPPRSADDKTLKTSKLSGGDLKTLKSDLKSSDGKTEQLSPRELLTAHTPDLTEGLASAEAMKPSTADSVFDASGRRSESTKTKSMHGGDPRVSSSSKRSTRPRSRKQTPMCDSSVQAGGPLKEFSEVVPRRESSLVVIDTACGASPPGSASHGVGAPSQSGRSKKPTESAAASGGEESDRVHDDDDHERVEEGIEMSCQAGASYITEEKERLRLLSSKYSGSKTAEIAAASVQVSVLSQAKAARTSREGGTGTGGASAKPKKPSATLVSKSKPPLPVGGKATPKRTPETASSSSSTPAAAKDAATTREGTVTSGAGTSAQVEQKKPDDEVEVDPEEKAKVTKELTEHENKSRIAAVTFEKGAKAQFHGAFVALQGAEAAGRQFISSSALRVLWEEYAALRRATFSLQHSEQQLSFDALRRQMDEDEQIRRQMLANARREHLSSRERQRDRDRAPRAIAIGGASAGGGGRSSSAGGGASARSAQSTSTRTGGEASSLLAAPHSTHSLSTLPFDDAKFSMAVARSHGSAAGGGGGNCDAEGVDLAAVEAAAELLRAQERESDTLRNATKPDSKQRIRSPLLLRTAAQAQNDQPSDAKMEQDVGQNVKDRLSPVSGALSPRRLDADERRLLAEQHELQYRALGELLLGGKDSASPVTAKAIDSNDDPKMSTPTKATERRGKDEEVDPKALRLKTSKSVEKDTDDKLANTTTSQHRRGSRSVAGSSMSGTWRGEDAPTSQNFAQRLQSATLSRLMPEQALKHQMLKQRRDDLLGLQAAGALVQSVTNALFDQLSSDSEGDDAHGDAADPNVNSDRHNRDGSPRNADDADGDNGGDDDENGGDEPQRRKRTEEERLKKRQRRAELEAQARRIVADIERVLLRNDEQLVDSAGDSNTLVNVHNATAAHQQYFPNSTTTSVNGKGPDGGGADDGHSTSEEEQIARSRRASNGRQFSGTALALAAAMAKSGGGGEESEEAWLAERQRRQDASHPQGDTGEQHTDLGAYLGAEGRPLSRSGTPNASRPPRHPGSPAGPKPTVADDVSQHQQPLKGENEEGHEEGLLPSPKQDATPRRYRRIDSAEQEIAQLRLQQHVTTTQLFGTIGAFVREANQVISGEKRRADSPTDESSTAPKAERNRDEYDEAGTNAKPGSPDGVSTELVEQRLFDVLEKMRAALATPAGRRALRSSAPSSKASGGRGTPDIAVGPSSPISKAGRAALDDDEGDESWRINKDGVSDPTKPSGEDVGVSAQTDLYDPHKLESLSKDYWGARQENDQMKTQVESLLTLLANQSALTRAAETIELATTPLDGIQLYDGHPTSGRGPRRGSLSEERQNQSRRSSVGGASSAIAEEMTEEALKQTMDTVQHKLRRLELEQLFDEDVREGVTVALTEEAGNGAAGLPFLNPNTKRKDPKLALKGAKASALKALAASAIGDLKHAQSDKQWSRDMFRTFPRTLVDRIVASGATANAAVELVESVAEWWNRWKPEAESTERQADEQHQRALRRLLDVCDRLENVALSVDLDYGLSRDISGDPETQEETDAVAGFLQNRGADAQRRLLELLGTGAGRGAGFSHKLAAHGSRGHAGSTSPDPDDSKNVQTMPRPSVGALNGGGGGGNVGGVSAVIPREAGGIGGVGSLGVVASGARRQSRPRGSVAAGVIGLSVPAGTKNDTPLFSVGSTMAAHGTKLRSPREHPTHATQHQHQQQPQTKVENIDPAFAILADIRNATRFADPSINSGGGGGGLSYQQLSNQHQRGRETPVGGVAGLFSADAYEPGAFARTVSRMIGGAVSGGQRRTAPAGFSLAPSTREKIKAGHMSLPDELRGVGIKSSPRDRARGLVGGGGVGSTGGVPSAFAVSHATKRRATMSFDQYVQRRGLSRAAMPEHIRHQQDHQGHSDDHQNPTHHNDSGVGRASTDGRGAKSAPFITAAAAAAAVDPSVSSAIHSAHASLKKGVVSPPSAVPSISGAGKVGQQLQQAKQQLQVQGQDGGSLSATRSELEPTRSEMDPQQLLLMENTQTSVAFSDKRSLHAATGQLSHAGRAQGERDQRQGDSVSSRAFQKKMGIRTPDSKTEPKSPLEGLAAVGHRPPVALSSSETKKALPSGTVSSEPEPTVQTSMVSDGKNTNTDSDPTPTSMKQDPRAVVAAAEHSSLVALRPAVLKKQRDGTPTNSGGAGGGAGGATAAKTSSGKQLPLPPLPPGRVSPSPLSTQQLRGESPLSPNTEGLALSHSQSAVASSSSMLPASGLPALPSLSSPPDQKLSSGSGYRNKGASTASRGGGGGGGGSDVDRATRGRSNSPNGRRASVPLSTEAPMSTAPLSENVTRRHVLPPVHPVAFEAQTPPARLPRSPPGFLSTPDQKIDRGGASLSHALTDKKDARGTFTTDDPKIAGRRGERKRPKQAFGVAGPDVPLYSVDDSDHSVGAGKIGGVGGGQGSGGRRDKGEKRRQERQAERYDPLTDAAAFPQYASTAQNVGAAHGAAHSGGAKAGDGRRKLTMKARSATPQPTVPSRLNANAECKSQSQGQQKEQKGAASFKQFVQDGRKAQQQQEQEANNARRESQPFSESIDLNVTPGPSGGALHQQQQRNAQQRTLSNSGHARGDTSQHRRLSSGPEGDRDRQVNDHDQEDDDEDDDVHALRAGSGADDDDVLPAPRMRVGVDTSDVVKGVGPRKGAASYNLPLPTVALIGQQRAALNRHAAKASKRELR